MTDPPIRVLLVEDNPTDVLLLREALAEVRLVAFELSDVAQLAKAIHYLSQAAADIILLDLGLPDSQGLETLLKLRRQTPWTPVVVLTGLADEELGLKALQAGAQDYLVKGQVEGQSLARAIRYAIERQQAEAALATERQRLRTLIDTLPDHIYLKDTAGRFITGNLAVARVMGVDTPEELVGKTDFDFYPPEPAARYFATEQAVIRSGQPVLDHEEPLFDARGQQGWLSTTQVPLQDSQGEVVGLVGISRDITEHKRIEQKLRESAEYFQATFDQAFVGMAHTALDGRWLRVNQKLCDIVGYSREELLQRTFQDITHPDDQLANIEPIKRALAGELHTYSLEKRYLHKEGQVIWVNLTVTLVRDAAGEPQYFITIIHDITARRQAEAEIQHRNRELALLNQVIAASTSTEEPEIFLETVCRELVEAFELSRVTAILFEQENTEVVVIAEAIAGPGPSALNLRFPVRRNPLLTHLLGHEGPLEVADIQHDPRLAPFREQARHYGVSSLLALPLVGDRNIIGSLNLWGSQPRHFLTEEINLAWSVADQVAGALARGRMIQVQQRLTTAIEQASESVIITDPAGTIVYVNPIFERVTGYSRAEVLGQTMRLVKSGQHEPDFYRKLWTTLTAGQVWQGRFINQKKTGELYTEEATITPVRSDNGTIINYVGVQRDVTHELQLEEQYRQVQKMEAIGRLSGGVAHDFNNLLVVINGYSELLLSRYLDAASPLRKYVEEIARAGERAAGLTQQLLAFSRKQVLQPKVVNLNETVAHTEKMLHRLIGEDIDVVIRLEPELGEVKADPGQIEQIILNLGVNARDAMPRGGKLIIETANVELDESYTSQHAEVEPGPYVMLAVSDNGLGMDAATKARIFEPFFTTKGQGQGTGLGLATVYGIVKQSGGDIWVYSEVGQGTTFKVYLPRIDEVISSHEVPINRVPVTGGTETVLLVEDESMVRTLARRVLETSGYTVLEAEHGQAALQLARQHQPIHLLLTDLIMPGGLTGRELAERLEMIQPGMKVLYMSGYTDDAIVHHGVLTSEVHFLQKPFSPQALNAKVRQVLDEG